MPAVEALGTVDADNEDRVEAEVTVVEFGRTSGRLTNISMTLE